MFNKDRNKLVGIAVSAVILGAQPTWADPNGMAQIKTDSLPVNVAGQALNGANTVNTAQKGLVSPSKAQAAAPKAATPSAPAPTAANAPAPTPRAVALPQANNEQQAKDDFDFELKMKSVNAPEQAAEKDAESNMPTDTDLPKDIQYKANPVEALGNSVLSQMDADLFSQMSEIEKSTTLLTLELRREKIRNEIEAQKAIRQKNLDELEREREEAKLKDLEKRKQIEAQVIKEQQELLDKEKVFEVLKQRKLLNAYMNQMLVNQQEWLKEKEALYEEIAMVEKEKQDLVSSFKQRIDKVLEASTKNIQVAEAARANFERIVKNLKARNEQLRKRVEADAKIIKNAKSSLYVKSQSIEELKDKNAAANSALAMASLQAEQASGVDEEVIEEVIEEKLSSKYAILGITGSAKNMSVEIINKEGQPVSLRVGSPLPTGHVVSEIGGEYVKFSKDGEDDYLYVGRSIDGIVPTLGLTDKDKQ